MELKVFSIVFKALSLKQIKPTFLEDENLTFTDFTNFHKNYCFFLFSLKSVLNLKDL